MNWLDAVFWALAAGRMVHRSRRGFVSAAAELGGAGFGLWLAVAFSGQLATRLSEAGGVPVMLGRPVVFAALLLPPAVLGQVLGQRAAALSRESRALWDRLLGALLGLTEATLLGAVALVAWAQLGGSLQAPALLDSMVAGWLLRWSPVLYQWLAGVLAL